MHPLPLGINSAALSMICPGVCCHAGSCAIVQYICRFFEEQVDDSQADTSKLYEGCSIQTLRY